MVKSLKKDLAIIIVLYSFAYFLMLLNEGVYWDDWTIFNVDKNSVIAAFRQYGRVWFGYLLVFFTSISGGIFFSKLASFLTYLSSSILLYGILKQIKGIDSFSRLMIVLFFALFPVNFARICLWNITYAACCLSFFLAFWFISLYLKKKYFWLRILSLLLFFISFSLPSLLVFYLIVIFYIIYYQRKSMLSRRDFIKKVFSYVDFFILPIAFWIFKIIFMKPYGFYQDTNVITYQNLVFMSSTSIASFTYAFLTPIDKTVSFFESCFLIPFPSAVLRLGMYAGLSIAIYSLLKKRPEALENNKNYFFNFLLFGCIAFLCAIFPYLAIGVLPGISDWSSRHQLLVPLGASIMFYCGIKIFMNKLKINFRIQCLIFSFLLSLFIMGNFFTYLEFQKDWFKQLSLIENFRDSSVIKNNTSFIFKDNVKGLNAMQRAYRFYEYTGLMKYAFGDETRFAFDPSEELGKDDIRNYMESSSMKAYILHVNFNMRGYKPKMPEYKVNIWSGSYKLNNSNSLKMMLLKFAKPKEFKEKIKNMLTLEYIKL